VSRERDKVRIVRVIGALCVACLVASPAFAQVDTAAKDTLDTTGWWARTSRASGLIITTGKTYNRIEGLPVMLGPAFHDSIKSAEIHASVLGIIRSADEFRWDSQNLGHRINADVRVGKGRGYSLGASSYDIVTPVEPWQLPDPDAGLAAFFGHRDFRDYFNRHGASATASFNMSTRSSLSFEWSDERWIPVHERTVFSVSGNGTAWRANPLVDGGRFHTGVLRANIDKRNDDTNPSTGWLILAEYERGNGRYTDLGLASPLTRPIASPVVTYNRALLDLRRYNRLSQTTWINARVVLGGWLPGDELPLQRRLSVGGIGTVPGFDYKRYEAGAIDVAQCSSSGTPPPGNPAQCERIALVQLEYRNEIRSSLFDFLNSRPIRLRGIGFTVQPTVVAFVDAGRGWLVGPQIETLQYPVGRIPPFGTFRTDVGLGLDLGLIGVYVAKSVSESKPPANVFLRVRRRF
jgi:hypothetical protein